MINTSYYGTEDTWIPYSSAVGYKYNTYTSNPAAGAYTENSRGTLSDLFRINKLSLNESPDLSVCYAGCDPFCDLANVRYINKSGVELGRITAAGATPFFLAAPRYYNSASRARGVINYQSDGSAWGMDTEGESISGGGLDNNDACLAPIVSMSGRSVVIHVMVLCGVPSGDTGISSTQLMSLDDYEADTTGLYTRIVGIYGVPMVYHGADRYQYQSVRYSTTDSYPTLCPITAQSCELPERELLHFSKSVCNFTNGMFCISGRGGTAGSVSGYYIEIEGEAVVPVFGDIWHIYHGQSGSGYFKYVSCYADIGTDFATKDAFIEYARRQAAYLGLFFTGDATLAQSSSDDIFNDPDMYLGVIDPDGITRGYYTHGADNEDQSQYDPESDMQRDTSYDPGRPYDPNRYDTTSRLNLGNGLSLMGSGVRVYAVNSTELRQLMQYLYLIAPELLDGTHTYEDYFLNNNPVDLIVGITAFPFDLTPYSSAATALQLGSQTVQYQTSPPGVTPVVRHNVSVNPLTSEDAVILLDAGSCTYFEHFGDYRDYEGGAELHIPYCGSVEIDPTEYMGHQISVKYLVDLATGACLALVYRDSMVYDSLPGQMGVTVPLSGIQQADYVSALHNARQQLLQARVSNATGIISGVVSTAIGAATGSPIGMIGGLMSVGRSAANAAVDDAQYKLDHVRAPIRTIGTASAATSMSNEQAVRLVITRPKMLSYDPASYGHAVGYACYDIGRIGDHSGFTQCTSVDLTGIEATDDELSAIRQLLNNGVYF